MKNTILTICAWVTGTIWSTYAYAEVTLASFSVVSGDTANRTPLEKALDDPQTLGIWALVALGFVFFVITLGRYDRDK